MRGFFIFYRSMLFELDPDWKFFPNPELAEDDGLLAIGGDLSLERLTVAYMTGVFPWYNPGDPILWWSLDPRMVMHIPDFKLSKSLRRLRDSGKFEVRIDTCFEEVIRACATTARKDQDGTWITEEMMAAYIELHKLGLAHSFETFLDDKLVGGLYGVSLSDFFSGESMFHHVTDASKIAFAHLVDFCALHHFRFIDAQQPTDHLASLGATPIPRDVFLAELRPSIWDKTIRRRWRSNSVVFLIGGNQGDREQNLARAIEKIELHIGPIAQTSSIYETAPWGFEAEQNFLNQAVVAETDMTPEETLEKALNLETELGRVRSESVSDGAKHYSSRPIDIDIIFFNSRILDTPFLQIPHPRMHLRRFVLEPLAEIIPDFIHPMLRKPVAQLLQECTDEGIVKKR